MRTIDTSVEQPTICYIITAQHRDRRRKELAQKYFFECQCKRCVDFEDRELDFARY